jgi:hypothetical protein
LIFTHSALGEGSYSKVFHAKQLRKDAKTSKIESKAFSEEDCVDY